MNKNEIAGFSKNEELQLITEALTSLGYQICLVEFNQNGDDDSKANGQPYIDIRLSL